MKKNYFVLIAVLLLISCSSEKSSNTKNNKVEHIVGIDEINVNFFVNAGKQLGASPSIIIPVLAPEGSESKIEVKIKNTPLKVSTQVMEETPDSSEISYPLYLVQKGVDWAELYNEYSDETISQFDKKFDKYSEEYEKAKQKIPEKLKAYRVHVIFDEFKDINETMTIKIGDFEKEIKNVKVKFTDTSNFRRKDNENDISFEAFAFLGLSNINTSNKDFVHDNVLVCGNNTVIKNIKPFDEANQVSYLTLEGKEVDPANINFTCPSEKTSLPFKIIVNQKEASDLLQTINSYDFIVEYENNGTYDLVYNTSAVEPHLQFSEIYLLPDFKDEMLEYFHEFSGKILLEQAKENGLSNEK